MESPSLVDISQLLAALTGSLLAGIWIGKSIMGPSPRYMDEYLCTAAMFLTTYAALVGVEPLLVIVLFGEAICFAISWYLNISNTKSSK